MELTIKSILAPIDFSDYSINSLKYAVSFAKQFQSSLILIYVIEPIVYPPDFSMGQLVLPSVDNDIYPRAVEELEKLANTEVPPEIKAKTIIKTGKPFIEIIETAKEESVDLIIIASHGSSGVEHMLFGSTAEKVVRKAPCPVLTLRDPLKGFDYKSRKS